MKPAQRVEPANVARISSYDLARLSVVADREAGIQLGPTKAEFVTSRLSRRLISLGFTDYRQYCDLLDSPQCGDEIRVFLEAIATHTTSFFRESGQFDWLLENGFAEMFETGAGKARDLVIWSAACSTGQELYTAMIVADQASRTTAPGLRFSGIGTDLSREVVETAKRAVYARAEVMGVPKEMRPDCLLSSISDDGRYRIVPALRRRTQWRLANLTKPETLSRINADIAFLRNVLIYFDDDTQLQVVKNVVSRLRPGGILMTGHSETAQVRNLSLTPIRPTIYRKETL